MKIVLGVTSSIAAYRIPNLISGLLKRGHEVQSIITEKSRAFVAPQSLAVMSRNPCLTDSDEWGNTQRVLHIELAKWCDVLLIAPLSANTLAKIAYGFCDNLLTSTVRALGRKPLLLAPAMNTRMWDNPLTAAQLQQAGEYYRVITIAPVAKRLADGDEGVGALAEDESIIEALEKLSIAVPE
jgi:phosphopantothenoylcysteine synthetase/decarboxylase